jgi:3-oxoacyl-[acyl-carrier protein] reductase
MDLGIKGKSAIVCASSRGLGKACAYSLAINGVNITLNGRDINILEKTKAEISIAAPDVNINAIACDVSSEEGRLKLIEACPEPDILVNNNGGPPFRDFREVDRDAIIEGVEMNMIAPIELVKGVIDGMSNRGFGRIVNITSVSVKRPVVGLDLSSGARAGLTAFLSGVARSVADKNITINNILPGFFDTDRLRQGVNSTAKMTNESENAVADRMAASIPVKRFGAPNEFGETCAFLCSEQAAYITGQNILLDGGLFDSSF